MLCKKTATKAVSKPRLLQFLSRLHVKPMFHQQEPSARFSGCMSRMEEEQKRIKRIQKGERKLLGLINKLYQKLDPKYKVFVIAKLLPDITDRVDELSANVEEIWTMLENFHSMGNRLGCRKEREQKRNKLEKNLFRVARMSEEKEMHDKHMGE